MKYFAQFPLSEYWFVSDEDSFYHRDLFIKVKISDYLKDNPKFLNTHVIRSYERPDEIANKLYGNSHLYWTIFLANDILDPKEWLMNDRTLDKYIQYKYENTHDIHHYTRDGVVADLRSAQIQVNRNPFGTVDSDPNPEFDILDPATYYGVTNAQYEDDVNDEKRIIRAIRPEYMTSFLKDVERKIKGFYE